MFDVGSVLTVLQHGDSAYPAGGFAFSWGIEGLVEDGVIRDRAGLDRIVDEHLRLRWHSMDRPLLSRAFTAASVDAVAEVDRYCDAATPCAEVRDGSRRAGRALLGTSARLGGALSLAYRELMAGESRLGHLPIAQAIAYTDAGLSSSGAHLLSGWTLATGLVSAAVRLAVIGHVEAQHSLLRARQTLAELLATPESWPPSSFTPLIDIAIARAPSRHVRLFAT